MTLLRKLRQGLHSSSVIIAAVLALLPLLYGCTTSPQAQAPETTIAAPPPNGTSAGQRAGGHDPLLDALAKEDPAAAAALEATLREIAGSTNRELTSRGPGANACPTPSQFRGNPQILKAWQANPARTAQALNTAGIRFPQDPPRPPTCQ